MDHPLHDHPLAHSFARAQTLSPYINIRHGAPAGDGWLATFEVFAADSERFSVLEHAAQQRLRTRAANVVAAALLHNYQWQLLAGPIACWLLDRRVPEFGAAAIQVHYTEEHTDAVAFAGGRFMALRDDPAANHPDAVVVDGPNMLRDALRAGLEAHLGQAIEQLCARLGSKPRGLWLSAADGCAGMLTWLMQQQDAAAGMARIRAEVDALVHAPGSPLNTGRLGLLELSCGGHSQVFLQRAGCCYWYKTEGGDYCSTCPHRTPADRTEQLLKDMAAQLAVQAGA